MHIVRASQEDAEALLTLQKLAYRSEAELYHDDTLAPLTQTLDELLAQFNTQVILKTVADGAIIGTVRAYEKDGTCYIGRLAVHPAMRRQGVGTALMKEIERYFTSKRFELFVGTKSEKNIQLYQKLGYAIFKKERYGCGAIDVFYMEKCLVAQTTNTTDTIRKDEVAIEKKPTNEFAIASLIMGIVSFVTVFNIEKGLVAVVFGLLALKKLRANHQLRGKKFAMIGMILGSASALATIIIIIKYMPHLMQPITQAAPQGQP